MTLYKLIKGDSVVIRSTLQEIEAFKQANPEWAGIEAVSYWEEPVPEPEPDPLQIVKENIAKGEAMILDYLADNRRMRLTNEQSLQQLQKFQVIKALLQVGDLGSAKYLLSVTEVDDVFTQERKDKYLAML